MSAKWKIYLSSTYKDLKDLRAALIAEFGKDKYKNSFEFTQIMEHMDDDGTMKPSVDVCLENVTKANIYILILGDTVGSIPDNETRTYTEMELDCAISQIPKGKKVFTFIKDTFNPTETPKHTEVYNKISSGPKKKFTDYKSFLTQLQDILLAYVNTSPINSNNPYKGLASFNIGDGEYFFGRDSEIERCIKELVVKKINNDNLFISVIGSSGIGKTSFVQAGLLYGLCQNKDFADFKPITIVPGSQPFTNLLYELNKIDLTPEKITSKNVKRDNLILFFNQFEEIISQCATEESKKERSLLFKFLDSLTTNSYTKSNLVVITTFRSDFYSALANFDFIQNQQWSFALSSLDYTKSHENWKKSIEEIIKNPALKNGVKIQDDLVSQLVNEIKEVEGSLSILQFTLEKIWNPETIEDRKITSGEFNRLADGKGISGIIEVHAEQVVERITENGTNKEKENILKSIFVNLVEVTDSLSDVKKSIKKSELFEKLSFYPEVAVDDVFDDLVGDKSRLLVVDSSDKENPTIDIIHEVLIRKWKRLKDWVEVRREDLAYGDKVAKKAREWSKNNAELYTGDKLKKLQLWAKSNPDLVNETTQDFLLSSQKKRKKKIFYSIAVIMAIAILIPIAFQQIQMTNFKSDIAHNDNITKQLEAAGGDIDSIKTLTINTENYGTFANKLSNFKNLKTLVIDGVDALYDLSEFKENNSITNLKLIRNVHLKSLKGVENFTTLRSVIIDEKNRILLETNDLIKNNELNTLKVIGEYDKPQLQNFLQTICQLKSLDTLDIGKNFEQSDFVKITNLEHLKFLKVQFGVDSRAKDEISIGLDLFKNMKKLKSLSIEVYDAAEKYRRIKFSIKNYPKSNSIENLEIIGANSIVCDENSFLKKLTIDHSQEKNLDGIQNLHSLEFLKIKSNNNLNNLNFIKNMPNLKTLELVDCYSIISLNVLDEKKIEKFATNIVNDTLFDNLLKLKSLYSIKSLKIDIKDFGPTTLNNIKRLKLINYLQIGGLTTSDLTCLTGVSHINKLELSMLLLLNNLNGIENLSINNLTLYNCSGLKSLKGIERLKSLDSLTLTNSFALESLKGIENIKGLKFLTVYNEINDTILYKLHNLKEIRFRSTNRVDYKRFRKNNPGARITVFKN